MKALTGGIIGSAVAAGAAYSFMPVFAPAVMLWAANLGLIAGGMAGLSVAAFQRSGDYRNRNFDERQGYAMGGVLSMFVAAGFGIGTTVTTMDGMNSEVYDALEKTVKQVYGNDYEGGRQDKTIELSVPVFGGDPLPYVAKFTNDPNGNIYVDSSTLKFKACATFDVAARATPDKVEFNYEICNYRDLSKTEIKRIVPTFQ